MIDTPMDRRKYPKGIILLAQSLKEDYPTNLPPTRINTNIQTILKYTYIIFIKEYMQYEYKPSII